MCTKFRSICFLQVLNNLITEIWPRWILPAQSGNGALPVTACSRCIGCGLGLRGSGGELCWLLSLPVVEQDEGVVQKELDFLLLEPGWSRKSLRSARLDLWIDQEENITYIHQPLQETWTEDWLEITLALVNTSLFLGKLWHILLHTSDFSKLSVGICYWSYGTFYSIPKSDGYWSELKCLETQMFLQVNWLLMSPFLYLKAWEIQAISSWHKFKHLGQIYIGKVKKVIHTEQWLPGIIHTFLATLPF